MDEEDTGAQRGWAETVVGLLAYVTYYILSARERGEGRVTGETLF